MNIAVSLKIVAHNISVSMIMVSTDNQQLNPKAIGVNTHIADFCKDMNFCLIDNSKRVKMHHLNNSRPHLTKKGLRFLVMCIAKKLPIFLNDIHLAI